MRKSKRTQILDAIVAVIEQGGLAAVTYDAVCEKTGLTRGGLLYHFPSRDALVLGVHEHLSARWDAGMVAALGGDPAQATQQDRLRAYVGNVQSASRAEMLVLLESALDPVLDQLWRDVLDRWAPPAPAPGDEAAMALFIVRLASDGLWVNDALSGGALPEALKAQVHDYLQRMIDATDASTD